MKDKILFITPPFHYPPKNGGDVRTCNYISVLSIKYNVDILVMGSYYPSVIDHHPSASSVYYLTLPQKSLYSFFEYRYKFFARVDIYILGIKPHSQSIHGTLPKLFLKRLQNLGHYTHHVHRYPYFLFAEQKERNYKIIVDVDDPPHSVTDNPVNLNLKGLRSQVKLLTKKIYNGQKLQFFENLYDSLADYLIFVTQEQILKKFQDKSSVLPNIGVIGESCYGDQQSRLVCDKKKLENVSIALGFLGSLSHPPNVEGILHFIENIWYFLSKDNENIRLLIAGSGLPPSVFLDVIEEYKKNIKFLGFIENISDFYQEIDVSIAPILSGNGSNIKVVQSLSMGVPVIGTSFALRSAFELGLDEYVRVAETIDDWRSILSKKHELQELISASKTLGISNQINQEWSQKLLSLMELG
jgi:glycosyltransferase involved in cell wall biosynthesis